MKHTHALLRAGEALRPKSLFFFWRELGFDVHVVEFARFEDFTALEALDVLRIFVSRNNLDPGMPTLVIHCVARSMVVSCI